MKRQAIEQLLPEVIQRTLYPGSPLAAILDVMEAMHARDEEILDHIQRYFSPYLAPAEWIPSLALWLDLGHTLAASGDAGVGEPASGMGHLRNVLANAADLAKWRGTAYGLQRMLEMATGTPGFVIDEQIRDASGAVRPFHIRITIPEAAAAHWEQVRRIVEAERPAYVTYEIVTANTENSEPSTRRNGHAINI